MDADRRVSPVFCLEKTRVYGPGVEPGNQSTESVSFSIETMDSVGELWTTAEDVRVTAKDPSGRNLRCKVFHVKQATYQVSLVRAVAGTYRVDVAINNASLPTPFLVQVDQVSKCV